MASKCSLCARLKKPGQPTTTAIINDVCETVHCACLDFYRMPKEEVNKKWNFKTMRLRT